MRLRPQCQVLKEWEGTNLSRSQWVDFYQGPLWKAFLFELAERERFLYECFKDGDPEWSPEFLRGKLSELDFFRNIPALLVASIDEANKKEEEQENG